MNFKFIIVALVSIVMLISCSRKDDYFSNPEELIITLSITEDYDKTIGRTEALKNYLSEKLEMPVKLYKVSNGTAVIEAMKAEKTHIGSVGAFSYIVAKSKIDIDPLVTTYAVSDTIEHNYKSRLIVPKSSRINFIEDLKKHSKNLSLAWSYPTSTSGHLVPRGYLQSIGLYPEDFKEVMVSENHAASVYSCVTEKIDVAAVSSITLKEYVRRGKIAENDFKIIWSSQPIQRGAIIINNKVNPEFKEKIKTALSQLHIDAPKASKTIHFQYDYDVKYAPVTDSAYTELRKNAKGIGLIE